MRFAHDDCRCDFIARWIPAYSLRHTASPRRSWWGRADPFPRAAAIVLVVDTETRHLSAAKAAEAVARLTRSAVENGVGCIYKRRIHPARQHRRICRPAQSKRRTQFALLPAFPQIGGTTKRASIIDGVPVNESPFGIDPFEPGGALR